MIINGGSRSNGRFFAAHLMRADHNERVDVREVRGFSFADDVPGAFREMQDLASGTACKNYFYHADINTREDERLSPKQWMQAADALEQELGLTGQPRLIVEHQKEGRTHQHIIWSRIDADSMRAIPDSNNFRRHEMTARALEQAFGQKPTIGPFSREIETPRPERSPKDWEAFRAQESKIDPKALKAEITELWNHADTGQAFAAALADRGFILARGDRRDFCIIDQAGDEHSLSRRLSGVKAAEVRARMADIDAAALPSVEEGRAQMRQRHEPPKSGGNSDAQSVPISTFELMRDQTIKEAQRFVAYEQEQDDAAGGSSYRYQAWLTNLRAFLATRRDLLWEWFAHFLGGDEFDHDPHPSPHEGIDR